MNGNALKGSDSDGNTLRRELDVERGDDGYDDETRRAWAAAFGASVPIAPPRTLGLGAAGESAPVPTPTVWRQSDVSMTEIADEIARVNGTPLKAESGEGSASVVSRLETVVNGGHLGTVSFVVDRSNAGVSIVVEVSTHEAAQAVDADRQTLLRSLRAAGLTVLSFRILNRAGTGTPLAHRSSDHAKGFAQNRTRYSRARLEDDAPEEGAPDPDAGRVEVVG
jgi:hypothetical protein